MHDPFQIVFNRFLRSEQLRIDRINLAQTGIKRRRFPRTGRPGRDENAVRAIDHFEQKIVAVLRLPERPEIEVHNRAIKHAQHEAFAKLSRQGRNSKIDAASRDVFLDATILGQASFRDIHVRHNLDARDDWEREMPRRR